MNKNLLNFSVAMFARIAGSGSHYITNILIAKMLLPSDAGILFIGISITLIGSTVVRLGLDNFLLKRISILSNGNSWQLANKLIKKCIIISAITGVAFVVILTSLNYLPINQLNFLDKGKEEISIMVFSIPFFAVFMLMSACFKAIEKANIGTLFESASWPGMFCLSVTSLYLLSILNTKYLSYCFLLNSIIISAFSLFLWLKVTKHRTNLSELIPVESGRTILLTSWPMMGVAVFYVLIRWSDALWVGYFLAESDVAVYTVASRTAGITAFFSAAVTAIIAPKYAIAYSQSDFDRVYRIFTRSVYLLTSLLAPIVFFLFIYSDRVMMFFSDDYVIGKSTFKISLVLQFVYAITIPIGYMVLMINMEKLYFKLMFISLVLSQTMFFLFTPNFGIEGAAWASGIAPIILNFALIIIATNRIKRKKKSNTKDAPSLNHKTPA
tara:strand:- start:442 stop:1761 length:1320 start_codon:yes stop_codon:yes gene_type:complete